MGSSRIYPPNSLFSLFKPLKKRNSSKLTPNKSSLMWALITTTKKFAFYSADQLMNNVMMRLWCQCWRKNFMCRSLRFWKISRRPKSSNPVLTLRIVQDKPPLTRSLRSTRVIRTCGMRCRPHCKKTMMIWIGIWGLNFRTAFQKEPSPQVSFWACINLYSWTWPSLSQLCVRP